MAVTPETIPGPLSGAPLGLIIDSVPPLQTEPVIFPVFDGSDGAPQLAYQLDTAGGSQVISVRGGALEDIVSAAFVDVNVGGNAGPAPIISSVGPITGEITVDPSLSTNGDVWGLRLTDSGGTEYAPPSAVHIFT